MINPGLFASRLSLAPPHYYEPIFLSSSPSGLLSGGLTVFLLAFFIFFFLKSTVIFATFVINIFTRRQPPRPLWSRFSRQVAYLLAAILLLVMKKIVDYVFLYPLP
ncbi:MAG: hypothetical protein WC686_01395 [Candidatus Shapirobacteria bacterium]|jgi:hypothetical protein